MANRFPQRPPGSGVPKLRPTVRPRTQDHPSAMAEADAVDLAAVEAESMDQGARSPVPHSDDSVTTSRDDALAVGMKVDGLHTPRVGQARALLSRACIPDPRRAIPATC